MKVLGGEKPSRPASALGPGISDEIWKLLEESWQTQRTLRPSVMDFLSRVKVAASVSGTLSPLGGIQGYEDHNSGFAKFGVSSPHFPKFGKAKCMIDQFFLA